MRALADGLWVAEQPLVAFGLPLGARMTIVRTPDGSVALHSPIQWTPELETQVRALGEVRWLIAPNRFHHMFIGDWKTAFPDAQLWAAPGLDTKRMDLTWDGVLDDAPIEGLSETFGHVCIRGMPLLNEVVWYHHPSRTGVVTDLGFNVQSPTWLKWFLVAGGATHPASPTLLELLLIRDRRAFRASFDRFLRWPIDGVIVAHGEPVAEGGHALLTRGYSWV